MNEFFLSLHQLMEHLTNIRDIEQTLAYSRLCLFFIKAPDCWGCSVILDRVGRFVSIYPSLYLSILTFAKSRFQKLTNIKEVGLSHPLIVFEYEK